MMKFIEIVFVKCPAKGCIFVLTRAEGVREFLDKIGHLNGDDDHGKADELDGQLERAFLGLDRGTVEVQGTEHE